MLDFLYAVFIFPIEFIIEAAFVFIYKIFRNPALSVFGVSFTFSILTLLLYFMAEKQQQAERDKQNQMKKRSDAIKAVFKGDKRFMLLSALYRQNNYHPIYSLRSSISLVVQIPFFIAAFHFLLNLEILKNVSFGPIADLSKPDALLSVNILPFVMTFINCISAAVYCRGFALSEKLKLYGISLIFLVLLYNSPAAMVLYWTCNNIISLIKNCLQKTKYSRQIVYVFISLFSLFLAYYLIKKYDGPVLLRISIAAVLLLIPVVPFILKILIKLFSDKNDNIAEKDNTTIFILSAVNLFLLAGFVIPSSLIASSVQEFSFIGSYKSPFPFLINSIFQAAGIFMLWPLFLYFLFSEKNKIYFAKAATALFIIAALNVFVFSGNYGFLTVLFVFPQYQDISFAASMINLGVTLGIVVLVFMNRYKKIIISCFTISLCAFLLSGITSSVKIFTEFRSYQSQLLHTESKFNNFDPVYQFSATGKNILVIMLDRAISGYVPYIFEEKPELLNSFDGFTWYKNTVSFGGNTNYGAPGLFGGYEYTPLQMQARSDTPMYQKHNESLLMLPRIFLEHDFQVTVTDPTYANYSWVPDLRIFDDYPQINAQNIEGKYSAHWIASRESEIMLVDTAAVIKSTMIRFAFFKFAPPLFRTEIYNKGKWLKIIHEYSDNGRKSIPLTTLNQYIALDVLPDITKINNTNINTYNVMINNLPHSPHFFQAPEYNLSNEITNRGTSPYAHQDIYHVNIASLMLLGKWFDFLKQNDVYDNTRIIIASDHGWPFEIKFPDSIKLPNAQMEGNLEAYAALLLVKDFNEQGSLKTDNTFMTNADVPFLALNGVIENPVNPWTGNTVKTDKENGITLTLSYSVVLNRQIMTNYIGANEWLHVHTNIFDPKNWTPVTYP